MVKTMLTLLSLAATVPLATAGTLTCAIDGAGSLDSAVDAAVYLWASSQRCTSGAQHSDTKCAMDVASAIKSVNDMIDIIVGAVDACEDVKTKHAACGLAVGSLTSAAAGLAAGGANLGNWIEHKSSGDDAVQDATTTKVGLCIVDAKGVTRGIFEAAAAIKAAKKGCDGKACPADALQVLAVLSSMGGAIASSVDDCSKQGNSNAELSADVLDLFGALNGVAQAGVAVHTQCGNTVAVNELYLESDNANATSNHAMSFVLAAFLPLSAVLGFVAGRRVNKARPTRDLGSMIEAGEE